LPNRQHPRQKKNKPKPDQKKNYISQSPAVIPLKLKSQKNTTTPPKPKTQQNHTTYTCCKNTRYNTTLKQWRTRFACPHPKNQKEKTPKTTLYTSNMKPRKSINV